MKPLVVMLAAGIALTGQAEPLAFRAEYLAEYRGLPIKADGVRELVRLGDGGWQLRSTAESALIRITETSEFSVTDGTLRPLQYHYERRGPGGNKRESVLFDWQSATATHRGATSALLPGTLDKLSWQYQLRLDVAGAVADKDLDRRLEYTVADADKRKVYRFQIAGEETLDTLLGDLHTLRVNRTGDDKETSLWLARDHDYLLVRLRRRGLELNLKSFTFP